MDLDPRTLILALGLVNLTVVVILVVLHRQRFPVEGPGLWAVGIGLAVFSQLLFGLSGVVPIFVSSVVGNVLLVLGFGVVWVGTARFFREPEPWDRVWGAALLMGVGVGFFRYAVPSLEGRLAVGTTLLALVCLAVARLLFRSDVAERTSRLTGAVFVANALVFLGQVPVELLRVEGAQRYLASPSAVIVYLWAPIFSVAVLSGFLLMTSARLHRELQELAAAIPICAGCKKMRDDEGSWDALETYLVEHTSLRLTHGMCPDCAESFYPEIFAAKGGGGPEG